MLTTHRSKQSIFTRLFRLAAQALLVISLLAGAAQSTRTFAQSPRESSASSGLVTGFWSPTGAAPQEFTPRYKSTVVWTGTEVIFWGGVGSHGVEVENGARYNPATNTWRSMSTVNAPHLRGDFAEVWTGKEMIVWAGNGYDIFPNTGGRYNPTTDTWTPMSSVNAPENQTDFTAVWTGTEMIIWGGNGKLHYDTWETLVNTGGRYDPETDTWTQISTVNAPAARQEHSAVWTGGTSGSGEMIVWGGVDDHDTLSTGGRYNPATDTWTPTSLVNAPQPREYHVTVWTGGTSGSGEMIVWGGDQHYGYELANGGRYNPTTDTWTPTSTVDAPYGRNAHTAVWTGGTSGSGEMIVWGGYYHTNDGGSVDLNSGARYNPATDTWVDLPTLNAPTARYRQSAIWVEPVAGRPGEMIIWGGVGANSTDLNTGGRYWLDGYFNFLPACHK